MAVADYYLCDVCGSKTFYDSELDWREGTKETDWEDWLPNVGAMKVICKGCIEKGFSIRIHED